MITTLAYVKTKRSKSSEECPHLTRAPGKYKLDHQRGCDIPPKHLLVNRTVTVVKAEILCSSSYSTSQLWSRSDFEAQLYAFGFQQVRLVKAYRNILNFKEATTL